MPGPKKLGPTQAGPNAPAPTKRGPTQAGARKAGPAEPAPRKPGRKRTGSPDAGPAKGAAPPARRNRSTEEVRAQILEAAAHLFAQQAPPTVTLRQIAARADVQHSLIIRHFGSKAGLVRAVVDRTAGAYAESVLRGDDAADGFVQAMRHLLENPVASAAFVNAQRSADQPRAVQRSYPGATLHRQLLTDAAGPQSRDPRVVAAVGLTLAAGWAMLEGWARVAFDLEAMPIDELRNEVAAMLRDLIERGADLGPATPPSAARRR